MGALAAGSVVLVPFPFSNLSEAKLRPAIVLADAGRNDWILCQVTSNPFADSCALKLGDVDFRLGGLRRISYVRPGKLFTACGDLVVSQIGELEPVALAKILDAVVAILKHQPPLTLAS